MPTIFSNFSISGQEPEGLPTITASPASVRKQEVVAVGMAVPDYSGLLTEA